MADTPQRHLLEPKVTWFPLGYEHLLARRRSPIVISVAHRQFCSDLCWACRSALESHEYGSGTVCSQQRPGLRSFHRQAMYVLTHPRRKWRVSTLLAGMLVGLGAIFGDGLAQAFTRTLAHLTDPRNAVGPIVLGSGAQFAAGVLLLLPLDRAPEQPNRKTAIYPSAGMAWVTLVGPPAAVICFIIPLWPLLPPLLVFLALWLLVLLAKMQQRAALLVALPGLLAALAALMGWLGLLSDWKRGPTRGPPRWGIGLRCEGIRILLTRRELRLTVAAIAGTLEGKGPSTARRLAGSSAWPSWTLPPRPA